MRLVLFGYLIFLGTSLARAGSAAEDLYNKAQKAERAGDTLHAYLLYARAAALDPANTRFQTKRNALASTTAGRAAAGTSVESMDIEAQLAEGELSPAEISDLREALPPPQLKSSSVKRKFDLRGRAQDILEQVAAAYGIKAEVESDYQSPPNFLFRTGEVGMEEALRALEQSANSLLVPVSSDTVLMMRDNPARRADSIPVMSKAIPIPERLSVQEAQEMVTAVQQTLEIRRIVVDPGRRMVYVRDSESKVRAATQLFYTLSRSRAQVEIEVQFLGFEKASSLTIGLDLPSQTELAYFGNLMKTPPSLSGAFTHFLTFGGGKTLFGFGVSNAAAFAILSRSSAETLLDAEILTVDGLAGSMIIGDHYPIAANQYIGNTGSTNAQVYVPPPQINYVDLGLSLKVTPTVHDDGDTTLEIDAQYNVLGTGGANGIPDVGQRKFSGKVRLAKDEWAIIAGLTQETHSVTTTGIAWLARLPLIGYLFRKDVKADDQAQVLIALKPHIVNLPPWEFPAKPLWVGTEGKPLTVF